MELLQWHNAYKISEDEVLRPPVVALTLERKSGVNLTPGAS